MKKLLLVGAVALGLSGVAFADGSIETTMPAPVANSFNPGVVIGLQAGYDISGWQNAFNSNVPWSPSVNKSNGFAGRVFLGWDFHPNFSVELGYFRPFNKPVGNFDDSTSIQYTMNVVDLMGKIKVPLGDMFDIYAKAGVDYVMTKMAPSATTGTAGTYSNTTVNNFNVAYGLGLDYTIIPNLVADISWTQYNANNKKDIVSDAPKYQPSMNFFALGLSYKFTY